MPKDTKSAAIKVVKLNPHYVKRWVFSYTDAKVVIWLFTSQAEVLRTYSDVMVDTKGVNNNCAHWAFDPKTFVENLDLGYPDYHHVICIPGEANAGSWSSYVVSHCGTPSPHGHDFVSAEHELSFAFDGHLLRIDHVVRWYSSSHKDGHPFYAGGWDRWGLQCNSITPDFTRWSGIEQTWKSGNYDAKKGEWVAPTLTKSQSRVNVTTPSASIGYSRAPVPTPLWHFGDTSVVNPLVLHPRPTKAYAEVLKGLEYDSFMNTLDSFQMCGDNNLANILSVAELISNALHFNVAGLWDKVMRSDLVKVMLKEGSKNRLWALDTSSVIKKFFSSLWLQYRYVFTTSVSDAKEIYNYVKRDRMFRGETWRVDGEANAEFLGTDYHIHCGYKVALADEDTLVAGINKLRELALLPSAYIIWDFIPFSFIADWFLNIGDYLGDKEKWSYVTSHYLIKEFYYTITYAAAHRVGRVDAEKYSGKGYTRYYSQPPAICYGASWGKASRRTSLKRLGDVAALKIGSV